MASVFNVTNPPSPFMIKNKQYKQYNNINNINSIYSQ